MKITNLIFKLYERYLDYKYRHYDDDVCCCGEMMSKSSFYYDSMCAYGGCRSMKEYTISNSIENLEERLKKWHLVRKPLTLEEIKK